MNKPARILVVEDQPLIAMALGDALDELGLTVIGPAQTLSQALQIASNEAFDAALLDIWLHDLPAYAVGEILVHRRVPFLITGGATNPHEPAIFRHIPRLLKPFSNDELRKQLSEIGVLPPLNKQRAPFAGAKADTGP